MDRRVAYSADGPDIRETELKMDLSTSVRGYWMSLPLQTRMDSFIIKVNSAIKILPGINPPLLMESNTK